MGVDLEVEGRAGSIVRPPGEEESVSDAYRKAAGDGILGGITAEVGAVVPVGQTIAWLLKPGEAVPAASAPEPEPAAVGAGSGDPGEPEDSKPED